MNTPIEKPKKVFFVFDIGGTNMRLAVSENDTDLNNIRILPTPQNFDEAMRLFRRAKTELCNGAKIAGAAGCAPGPFDTEKTMIANAPNLPDWNGKPLKLELENILGCDVLLENDADLAGLGEAVFGAGKNKNIVIYLTISTGVGGTRIINRKIDPNVWGMEPGHQIIDPLDEEGHLEGLVSGTAIHRRYGKGAHEITDPIIWEKLARFLAVGLHNTIVHWSPDIIVLGGSVMKSLPIERVRIHLEDTMKIFPKIPPLVLADLGDAPALYGALSLLGDIDFVA